MEPQTTSAPVLPIVTHPGAGPVQMLPPAEALHADVVRDQELFWKCLRSMWEKLGIQEKVPRVGGRELDLHMLYCNVTSLGGCERVIQRKHWRDAAESFNFPDTITSVSFSLRKAYVSFLFDFEQVYFFRMTGPRVAAPQPQKVESHGPREPRDAEAVSARKRKAQQQDVVATSFVGLPQGTPTQLTAFSRASGSPEAAMVGTRGNVVIDARFDAGYFVSVKIGRYDFKGALYFPPPEHTMEGAGTPTFSPNKSALRSRLGGKPEPGNAATGFMDYGSATKLDRGKDPLAPKPNKTPFNFFSVDARHKAKESFPELAQSEITKKVGEMWQKATDEEKAPYIAMSNQDKARYQSELEAYNYKLAAQASSLQAHHAATAVAAAQAAMAQQPLVVGGQVLAPPRQQQQQAGAATAQQPQPAASAGPLAAAAALSPTHAPMPGGTPGAAQNSTQATPA